MVTLNKWGFSNQRKIIVYSVPTHKAVDFIYGSSFRFVGDSELVPDGLLQNFHLKPGRISLMLHNKKNNLAAFYHSNNFYQFYGKRIVMIDSAVVYSPMPEKINVDYIILSKNPKLYISSLAAVFNCKLYIFDSSNSMWKIDKWKKDCEELHLRFHSVPEQGAFVTDL